LGASSLLVSTHDQREHARLGVKLIDFGFATSVALMDAEETAKAMRQVGTKMQEGWMEEGRAFYGSVRQAGDTAGAFKLIDFGFATSAALLDAEETAKAMRQVGIGFKGGGKRGHFGSMRQVGGHFGSMRQVGGTEMDVGCAAGCGRDGQSDATGRGYRRGGDTRGLGVTGGWSSRAKADSAARAAQAPGSIYFHPISTI
jgi:hypothetical protein